ncbi:hypothetical protein [Modestobacter sp. URMC 112]
MTAPGAQPAAPWDVSFLRVGVLATLAATAVAVPVVGVLLSWADALGVLVGAAVVAFFFCLSGLVIAWAGRLHDSFTLPAALGSFAVKVVLLFPVLSALPADGWLDRRTLAWTVVAGAVLWSLVQARWVWTRQLYYVPPPAPPARTGTADPEIPRTGG